MVEKRSRGRPKVNDPRRNQVNIHLTDREMAQLQYCAEQCQMPENDVVKKALSQLCECLKQEDNESWKIF